MPMAAATAAPCRSSETAVEAPRRDFEAGAVMLSNMFLRRPRREKERESRVASDTCQRTGAGRRSVSGRPPVRRKAIKGREMRLDIGYLALLLVGGCASIAQTMAANKRNPGTLENGVLTPALPPADSYG